MTNFEDQLFVPKAPKNGYASEGTCLSAQPNLQSIIPGNSNFHLEPFVSPNYGNFKFIRERVNCQKPFAFVKINHGTWEAFTQLYKAGLRLEDLRNWRLNQAKLANVNASYFRDDRGMLIECVDAINDLPGPDSGVFFVADLEPWPWSRVVEGTPVQGYNLCKTLIERCVQSQHLQTSIDLGLKGCVFKAAVITGEFFEFLQEIKERKIIAICNENDRQFFTSGVFDTIDLIQISSTQARAQRDEIYREILQKISKLNSDSQELPLILYAGGETMGVSFCNQLWNAGMKLQFLDLGGVTWGLTKDGCKKMNWSRVYAQKIGHNLKSHEKYFFDIGCAYTGEFGIRDDTMVNIANSFGVRYPKPLADVPAPLPNLPIQFIENKVYDFSRIAEFMQLSVEKNHHANGGPVTELLEYVMAKIIGLPETKTVVAVSSGTAALHIACALSTQKSGVGSWVTSAFNFLSANVGPLSQSKIIDCDENGRLCFETLQSLDPASFDGVIYTNVFGQCADWNEILQWCRENGKAMVVDNATGLLDRPVNEPFAEGCIEIISGHHTKAWGVGEAGFLILDKKQELMARSYANFGVGSDPVYGVSSSNYKISDLASAALLDRLERLSYVSQFYFKQQRRVFSILNSLEGKLQNFNGTTTPKSPRTFTPVLANEVISPNIKTRYFQYRKYYSPLSQTNGLGNPTPKAKRLFDHCLCIPNSPMMRCVSDDQIISDLRLILGE